MQAVDAPLSAYTVPAPAAARIAAEWERSAGRLTQAISGAPPGAAFAAALPGGDDDPWIRAPAWLGRSAG